MKATKKDSKYRFGWICITSSDNVSDMQEYILNTYGDLDLNQFTDAMLVVQKFFITWEYKVDSCSNGDKRYAPAVFVWYAKEILKVKSNVPLVIMREIYIDLRNKLNLHSTLILR
jgi:hypothetical protein